MSKKYTLTFDSYISIAQCYLAYYRNQFSKWTADKQTLITWYCFSHLGLVGRKIDIGKCNYDINSYLIKIIAAEIDSNDLRCRATDVKFVSSSIWRSGGS